MASTQGEHGASQQGTACTTLQVSVVGSQKQSSLELLVFSTPDFEGVVIRINRLCPSRHCDADASQISKMNNHLQSSIE